MNSPLDTLDDLNRALDALNKDCSQYCCGCHELDCAGYIWLLPEESDCLFDQNIPILEINDDLECIAPAFSEEDVLDITDEYPRCPLRSNTTGQCTCHEIRPFVCHLYPISIQTIEGKHFWIVYHDCDFIKSMVENGSFEAYITSAKQIIGSMSAKLKKQIEHTYIKVNETMIDAQGEDFETILPL